MAKANNIVHEYYKKAVDNYTLILKVNPIEWKVTELTIPASGEVSWREIEADETLREDLAVDGFEVCNPFEFNLYAAGLLSK